MTDQRDRQQEAAPQNRQRNRQQNTTAQNGQKNRKGTWDIRPYLAVGLTTILVVLVCLAIFFFLFRFQGFAAGVGKIINSLQGVIIGFLLAYLLNPVMKFFERLFERRLFTKKAKTAKTRKVIRALAVSCAMAIFLAIIVVLVMLIVPQLVVSVQDLVLSMGDKVDALMTWIQQLTRNDAVEGQLENIAQQAFDKLKNWLEQEVLGNGTEILTRLSTGVYTGIKVAINVLVGIIVAIYVLMTKERFVGQAKKMIFAVFKPRYGNIIMEVVQKADDVFGGFFIGDIIDALIIGCLCFVGTSILKMPYAPLISVIVGVTNIIPFFGPYIGAIPSAILIFLVNPIQAVYFLIFIVVLQQVDGNIIKPKVLGDTTGLSPFWVVFSILLFGGCFGVVGMLFGVPVFAVIYYIIKRLTEHFLKRRKLPVDTDEYVNLTRVDTQTNEIKIRDTEKKSAMHPVENNINKKKKKK